MAASATLAMRLVVMKRCPFVKEAKESRTPAPRPRRVLSARVLPLSVKREWGHEDDKNSDTWFPRLVPTLLRGNALPATLRRRSHVCPSRPDAGASEVVR